MSEKYSTLSKTVDNIIGEINNNEIAIPEIQRPFVWSKAQVRDLMDSLYNGYPVGYIIIWKNPAVRLKDGTLSDGKKILIDGQQRVTALMSAVTGHNIINQDYKSERIKIAFNPYIALENDDKKSCFEVQTPAHVKDSKWIDDISTIFKTDFNSFTFINDYCSKNPTMTNIDLNTIIEKLKSIVHCQIGVIELNKELDIDVVTDIFIRINSKATTLDQSDFVMSKIAADTKHGGNNIRKLIDYSVHTLKKPQDFDTIVANDTDFNDSIYKTKIQWLKDQDDDIFDPNYSDIIRIAFMSSFNRSKLSDLVALLSGRNFETRLYEESISEETYKKFEQGVLNVVNKDNYINFIKIIESAGFISKKLINSKMALDFAYTIYLLSKQDNTITLSERSKLVQKWYVLSVLTGRYSGSPESMFYTDLLKIKENGIKNRLEEIESAILSDAFWNVQIPQNLDSTSNNNPTLQVYLAAQVTMKDNSLLSNNMTVEKLIQTMGDIHHIFPKAFLKKNGLSKSKYNLNGNYELLDNAINKQIGDQAPDIYFKKAFNQCATKIIECGSITDIDKLKENLKINCIPEGVENMGFNRYEEFLTKRKELMANKIKAFYEEL